ncbi:MAG: hypothetical protein IKI22_05405 [Neisseriaceae bacterium]|nr:hypothetical protein [Neisseriaceae bacterium]
MKKRTNAKQSTFERYRGLIISIAIFLSLIALIAIFSIYFSRLSGVNVNRAQSATNLHNSVLLINQDAFRLKDIYDQDQNSPFAQATITRMRDNIKYVREELDNFDDQDLIAGIKQKWATYSKQLNDYLAVADEVHADTSAAYAFIDAVNDNGTAIAVETATLSEGYAKNAQSQIKILQLIQIIGVVVGVLYLGVSVFHFIGQMRAMDRKAENAWHEVEGIMSTLREGLFLVDKDLRIGGQYSSALEHIIGQRKLGGKNLLDILEPIINSKDLDVTKNFVGQLFKKRIKANLIADLNPLNKVEVEVDDFSGFHVRRWLSFAFSRVYDGSEIERVMVNVSDITAAVHLEEQLEEKRQQNDQSMDMLGTLLDTDPQLVNGFLLSVRSCIDNVNAVLRDQSKGVAELKVKLRDIYREMHSIKGEASALRLSAFVTLATNFEEKIRNLQEAPHLTGNDFLPLTVMLDEMVNTFNRIKQLADRLGLTTNGKKTNSGSVGNMQSNQGGSSSVMQKYFENFASDIAKRNEKEVKVVCRGMDSNRLSPELANTIKEVTLQLLRNAICHGIEVPSERRRLGKPAEGKVQLQLHFTDNDMAELIVEDDGGGLSFERIRAKAVEKGLYTQEEAKNLGRKELMQLIFSSGFSTADKSNEDAGRGVGMDVVNKRVQDIGGKLKIASAAGQYTRFTIVVPLNKIV